MKTDIFYLPVKQTLLAYPQKLFWKLDHFVCYFQFDRVCRLFSEDPTTTQSDEFFGTFDYFITSFEEARQDNESVKKKKEEEEKIAKQHQEVSRRIINIYRPIQLSV